MKFVATVGDGSEDTREIDIIFTNKLLQWGEIGIEEAKVCDLEETVTVKTVDITHFGKTEEVDYLKQMKHCNIVKLLYHFRMYKGARDLECIVRERVSRSLDELYLRPVHLKLLDIKLYMYQLLRSVAYIHSQGICHRDIEPANILIDTTTGMLKLCDFGSATDLSLKEENSTRFGLRQYRAPELLLEFKNYTNSVDVWAIGCILIELLNGQEELFHQQASTHDQLQKVIEVFGKPNSDQFPGMKPPYPFNSLPRRVAMTWPEIIQPFSISDDVVSLCSGLLCYSPSSRLLPHEALAHKFFDELRSPETTCLSNGNPLPPLFNFQPEEFPGDFTHLLPIEQRDEN